MKIIIFTGYFIPRKGGYIDNVIELSRRLIAHGHQITLLSANTHDYPEEEIVQGIHVIRLPCWHILDETYPVIKPTRKTFSLLYKLSRENFDIVSTQTRFFVTSLIGFLFAKFRRIRHIHTERGSIHSVVDSRFVYHASHFIDHSIGSLIVRYADHNVGVSQAACQFLRHLGAKKITFIPNGIDYDFYRKTAANLNEHFKLDSDDIIITFVGRLIYAKGVQDLIIVFTELKKTYHNIKLIIIGDGNYKTDLEELSMTLGVQNDVLFTGEKNKEEIVEFLSIYDIFVNPSYSEGLPTSLSLVD